MPTATIDRTPITRKRAAAEAGIAAAIATVLSLIVFARLLPSKASQQSLGPRPAQHFKSESSRPETKPARFVWCPLGI